MKLTRKLSKRYDVFKGDHQDAHTCAFYAMWNQVHARIGRKLTAAEEDVIRWQLWQHEELPTPGPN